MNNLAEAVLAVLLVTLRLGPTLAFASPFTFLRTPVLVRVLLAIGLSVWLVSAQPQLIVQASTSGPFLALVIRELAIGVGLALGLQLTFAAILWAGRVVDIQAGFGLAMLADPTTNAQIPLAGTILSYGAAAIFFSVGAQYDLIALWAASFDALPIGYALLGADLLAVANFVSTLFLLAIGLVGVSMLAIFLADLVVAFLSRTLPQMNVLLLGFQVKAMIMLVTLPLCMALALGLYLRLIRLAVTGPADFWKVAA